MREGVVEDVELSDGVAVEVEGGATRFACGIPEAVVDVAAPLISLDDLGMTGWLAEVGRVGTVLAVVGRGRPDGAAASETLLECPVVAVVPSPA